MELRRELRRLADEDDVTVILSEGRVIADDPIEGLVNVFQTQAYRVTITGDLQDGPRDLLDARFEAGGWKTHGDQTIFDITLTDGDVLYDVIDILRDAHVDLDNVDRTDPDLEDVFLEVTGTGPGDGTPEPALADDADAPTDPSDEALDGAQTGTPYDDRDDAKADTPYDDRDDVRTSTEAHQ